MSLIQFRPVLGILLLLAAISPGALAQEKQRDLTALSLEDLMNIEVTSVSKKEQKLSQTAAAVFAISAEDIRRSGAKNIPDLLRMVPGMDVAQIDNTMFAVSARGFNGRYANELLVLVDGREVYTPTFAGVFWDVLDLPLENIERIEVIRGPGGAVWGSNAVNGAINIITKSATDTQGAMIVAGGGNLGQAFGTLQFGDRLGKSTDYRVYTKYLNQDQLGGFQTPIGADNWHMMRGGFRTDSTLTHSDSLMVQGDIYRGREGLPTSVMTAVGAPRQDVNTWVDLSGGFLQSTWKHVFSSRSETTLGISFDRYKRLDVLGEDRNTFDLDFQHHFAWKKRHDIVWGVNYSRSDSNCLGSLTIFFVPAKSTFSNVGSFFQDEIALVPARLYFTVGTKVENNTYTGFNVMPTGRLVWMPGKDHTLWAAVSRAVRSPGTDDRNMHVYFTGFPGPRGLPVMVGLISNPNFDDEHMMAYEAGYRTTVIKNVSFDLAAFYNFYSNRATMEPIAPYIEPVPPPLHLLVPATGRNLMSGETHGLEIAANWKVTDRWMLSPGYAFQGIHMYLRPPSADWASILVAQGSTPVHSAQLRSHVNLTQALSWDSSAYFVDHLRSAPIPGYTRVDTGITWRPGKTLALSIFGQNLADSEHLEFIDNLNSVKSTLVGRSVYSAVTWHF